MTRGRTTRAAPVKIPVTLIPGDGIGPAITAATVRILEAAGAQVEWDTHVAGMAGIAKFNDPIPDTTLASIKRTRVALKGPLETPVGEGFRSINVALRKTFDLYANVRPAYTIVPGFTVTTEVDWDHFGHFNDGTIYGNWTKAKKEDSIGGIVRFQRSF